MKPHFITLFSIIAIGLFTVSCSPEEDLSTIATVQPELAEKPANLSNLELEILDLVNQHRSDKGLSKLEQLNIISNVADTHTSYMIENDQVSHDNFNQRVALLTSNAAAKNVGENVAYGFNSAQGVVTGWLNSEAHRNIIENPDYSHFGIAIEKNISGRNYFTQIFIER